MSLDIRTVLSDALPSAMLHNVRLVDVQASDDGYERYTIEFEGETHALGGGAKWDARHSSRNCGKWGYLVRATSHELDLPIGACYFREYMDQSLRRVPMIDAEDRDRAALGQAPETVGWICDARTSGFRAPAGLVPGQEGRFVSDDTVPVTIRVPPEFVQECSRVQMLPEQLLRSFVGDLAGICNFIANPRADGYGSNGSDERQNAAAWLERSHGMNAIDLDQLARAKEDQEERQADRDDLTAFLDDFEHYGGKAGDLLKAVQSLVDAQAKRDRALLSEEVK